MRRSTTWYAAATVILSIVRVSSAFPQACCVLPTGETTAVSSIIGQFTSFLQTVSHSPYSFDGRRVKERDGNAGSAFDGCYFTGSSIPP